MNTREKYNRVIEQIEADIQTEQEVKVEKICETAAQISNCSVSELSTVFTYLMGCSLKEYIRRRQLAQAYASIIGNAQFDVTQARRILGYTEQSSFNRLFKQSFGMTPRQAYDRKDKSLIQPPITWESLSMIDDEGDFDQDEVGNVTETKFGVSVATYERIMEANALETQYQFNAIQSDAAFYLSQKYGYPLKKSFEFVDDYTIQHGIERDDQGQPDKQRFIRKIERNKELRHIYFALDLSVDECEELIWEIHSEGLKAHNIHQDILQVYTRYPFGWSDLVEIYKDYKESGQTYLTFEEYLENPDDDPIYEMENQMIDQILSRGILHRDDWFQDKLFDADGAMEMEQYTLDNCDVYDDDDDL